jgi:RNA polymerase sigma factor (sigma-70 family)
VQEAKVNARPRPDLIVILSEKNNYADANETEELILNYRENGRKLARSFLRNWNVRMAADEIDSIVDVSLCEAAGRYDSERGASFMTFYYYHLRGHLVRAIASAARANNIFFAVAEAAAGCEANASEWRPTAEDVAHWLAPDMVAARQTEADSPEGKLIKKQDLERCRAAMRKLDSLEQEVVVRSYLGQEALVDIAKSLGYSRCHISRVKKRALERLRNLVEQQTAAAQPKPIEQKPVFTLRVSQSDRNQSDIRRRGRRRRVLRSVASTNFLAKTA